MMSNSYWNQHPPQPNWQPQLQSSEVLLASQLEQIRLLGGISEAVRPIPEMRDRIEGNTVRITRLEDKLDSHIVNCQGSAPRRLIPNGLNTLKENWPVVLLMVQLLVFLALQLMGQPDKAQQVWGTSPAFRNGERLQE